MPPIVMGHGNLISKRGLHSKRARTVYLNEGHSVIVTAQ